MKFLPLSLAMLIASTPLLADDGQMLRRAVSSPPGITEDPEPEGEHAFVSLMNLRVLTQRANGTVEPVEYYDIDDTLRMTLETAKPLINVFVYGPVIGFDDFSQSGFQGHGARDAFGAVSLDDGETWKVTNLSNSADISSFTLTSDFEVPDPNDPACHHTTTEAVASLAGSSILLVDDDDDNGDADDGLVIEEAEWEDLNQNFGRLEVEGEANPRDRVEIVDACDEETVLFTVRADRDGEFEAERNVRVEDAPYEVIARVDGTDSDPVVVEDSPAEPCVDDCATLTEYPGDVTNIFHSTAGNRVMAAWKSKYCQAGFPGYSLDDTAKEELATYLEIDLEADLYLEDLFVVGGSQGSTDYREQEEFPGEYDGVGEVPHSCLWSARAILREDPEVAGTTELVWFQAERLTSGRRDVNRVETKCVAGAGCAVTWQEDPEGLRPGEGEGPGTGWAGSTVAHKTDIWYTFVEWEDMDIVDVNGELLPLADNIMDSGRPQPAIPMMVPVRLTNNERCTYPVNTTTETYCNVEIAGLYGIEDQCVGSVDIPLGPQDELQPICVVDNNASGTMDYGDLPNVANTGASRPRLNLQPRDSDGDGVTDDAWIVIIHEESKGLGAFGFIDDEEWLGNVDDTGTPCDDPDADQTDNCVEEIGKNTWYISFAMGTPQTSVLDETAAVDVDFSMLKNIVEQQNQFNAPEVNFKTGTYYPPMDTGDMWDFGDTLNFGIFNNEIARRAALISQSLGKAEASVNKLMALPLFKEGVMNQGGPADIMARRVVLPDDFAGEQQANPYAFTNMECAWYDGEGLVTEGRWIYAPDENPYYPDGLCGAPTINLSARTPHECDVTGDSDGICPTEDLTCDDNTDFGQLCMGLEENDPEDNTVLDLQKSWYECPGWNGTDVSNGGNTGDSTIPGACYTEPESTVLMANLDDRSWYNPIDISKAHRGFLDGDHLFMLYAWSPNFKLNAVGRDRYELYTRRSFDGGISWTNTPGSFVASNGETYVGEGNVTCQTWRDGADSTTDSHICTEYAAGDPEQSRDVSQHKSMKITTLDPRFTPTLASMPDECPDWYQDDTGTCLSEWLLFVPITDENLQGALDPTDVKEPSRNWVVFESGDNTTVAVGEAEPLNLDYGRGEFFGDVITVWSEIDTDLSDPVADCYPSNPHDTTDVDWASGTGFCNEFDTLEGFPLSLSEEASITSSAYADFLYGVWGQFNVEEDPVTGEHVFVDGDAMFRRVWYIDDWISQDNSYTLPGLSGGQ